MEESDLEEIREKLKKRRLTQVWLAKQLLECGVRTDKATLSYALSGRRTGDKSECVIENTRNIIEDYDYGMEMAAMRRDVRNDEGIAEKAAGFLERFAKAIEGTIKSEGGIPKKKEQP